MKRTAIALLTLFSMASLATASERRDADLDRIQTASTVLSQIMSAPDRAIPDGIMNGAKCIAIMPSMLKASFVFGANYGKGVATCRTEHGWSAPAFFKLTGGSFGFQAGGQASDLVLIIRTDDGMQHLLQSKFKLGADASAAAGPVGRDAQAMTDLTLRAQVLTYSRSRGLFLGVSLSGGVINQDQADTQAFYGKDWTFYSVLKGQVPPPKDSEVLLNTVEKYAPTAKRSPVPIAAAAPTPAMASAPLTTGVSVSSPAATSTAVPAPQQSPASDMMPAAEATPETAPAAVAGQAAATGTSAAPASTSVPTSYATPASNATAPVATPSVAPAQTPATLPVPGTTGGH
jgi:lipid-binding SYLF domain-containing protein